MLTCPISLHVCHTLIPTAHLPLFDIAERFSSLTLLCSGATFEPPKVIIKFCQTKNHLPQLREMTEVYNIAPTPTPSPAQFLRWRWEQCNCLFSLCWAVLWGDFIHNLGKQKQF